MADTFIICPACQAKNRVPSARLHHSPTCGKCQASLLPLAPLELNASQLSRLHAHETLPLIVDFWAPWCGPCLQMAPTFEKVASQFAGQFRFAKLDTQAHSSTATQWAIRSIPTLIAFVQGKEVARQSGALSEGQLQAWLANLT
ncbi:thioredoxin TrxC [Oceanisphaera avium]|uniref:Thioredoxin n=1 Tax=Oceanisphaera avium TaxID=1903694 RepID=A0A1Y0CZJ4_9GAMM|nr:thioredoxin TrxC [Oceanisphaera avium]ART80750.1 thiol reductase thioredoxin [Oceanisphaera avium]